MNGDEKQMVKTQSVRGKTTTLIYDGGHRAEVWTYYRPELAPGDINRWRVVCCVDPADDTTGFTLVLYPTDGKGVTTPPSRITQIESVLKPLDNAALDCAHAFTENKMRQAMDVLREDVRDWTGHILNDAKLDKLLRFVRDVINVDQYGQPLGQRRAAFDCADLEQFAEAIAVDSGTPLEKLRGSILKSWQSGVAPKEANQARLLAFFDGHPKKKFCGIKSYGTDQWTREDHAQVDIIRGAAATPASAAVDEKKLAAVEGQPAPSIPAQKKKARKRGRKREHNAASDARLLSAWRSGHYRRYGQLAREKNMSEGALVRALQRARARERNKARG